jgi:integrase
MSVRKREWTTRKGEQREAFIVHYLDQDGDPHIETFQLERDAKLRAAEIKVAVKKGKHTAPSKSVTVAEAADKWIRGVAADGRERSTVDQYRQHAVHHIGPRIGKVKLANLTPARVGDFRDDLLAGLSRPLAKKVLTSLKGLLRAAGYAHVADGVSIAADSRNKRKLETGRDIPTPAEVKRLIDAAKDDARVLALLLTAALTGLRASELRGLRWYDVDLKACELHVRQKADKYGSIGAPKSASSMRTVPIDPDMLLPALKSWKLACPVGDLVFPARSGGIAHHQTVLMSLNPVMQAAGVTRDGRAKYALHAFRHFFASWCINAKDRGGRELPPKAVQTLLGHSSIVMTMDTYGHMFPRGDDRAELQRAVHALLG